MQRTLLEGIPGRKNPCQILEKHGYPADVLGKERIWGIAHIIKGQYYSEEGLREGSLKKSPSASSDCKTTEETVKQLQNEVQYFRQEIEFLKNFFDQNYPEVGALFMNKSSCV